MFIRSVRATTPTAKIHLVTNETSSFSNDFDCIHRFPVAQNSLMLERLKYQIAIIETLPQAERVCLLDTDILVLKPLDELFDGSFDVAVTIRDDPKYHFEFTMPYNNGVILLDLKNKSAVLEYLRRIQSRVKEMPLQFHAWSGNQFAVKDILGERELNSVFSIGAARVVVLPCSTHNYTPATKGEILPDVHILHFRGDAKPLMRDYAHLVGATRLRGSI